MKDWEIKILNEQFSDLDKVRKCLREKKNLVESIENGDLIFIHNKNRFDSGLSYIGEVNTVVGLCSNMQNYAIIPINFKQGKCKIVTFENGKVSSADAEPAYQGTIYHSSELYKGKETIENILKKEYKTNLKEIGLE